MKKLTEKQFYDKIKESWELDIGDDLRAVEKIFAFMLEAKHLRTVSLGQGEQTDEVEHDVYLFAFKNPKVKFTHAQICEILDAGNHCISSGTIIYENEYAYITWSNLGHI